MREIKNLHDFKERVQAGFDNNEKSLDIFGKTYSTQLKAYLIESNRLKPEEVVCPNGHWQLFDDTKGWFSNKSDTIPNTLFLDCTRKRVWILYSLMDATESDIVIDTWLENNMGLDRCWLSRKHLLHWEKSDSWCQRGLGLKFSDGLSPEDEAGNFTLKAWHGANRYIEGLDDILIKAKEKIAIYSVRWQNIVNGSVAISAEWYSNGKVTINRAIDVDEVLLSISEMANIYSDALIGATELRDKTLGAFEIDFSQKIDLEAFTNTVVKGKGDMKLWLVEVENDKEFNRYKGVDLHTWDRILLDVGSDYAYLTIPGKGCINAAPRIATLQGEDNAGKTTILHDGVEVFA
jgi:hypothetical protein